MEKPEAKINATIPLVTFQVSFTKNGLIEISNARATMTQNLVREVPWRVLKKEKEVSEEEKAKNDENADIKDSSAN